MAEQSDAGTMFERCMALNREAFDAGHYNTAYHTLAAAPCTRRTSSKMPTPSAGCNRLQRSK
jgi:hypothetical protein